MPKNQPMMLPKSIPQPPILIVNRHRSQIISRPYLKKNVEKIFDLLRVPGASVEITLVSDVFMRQQNKKHRGYSKTTDVLSFPSFAVDSKDIGNPAIFSGVFLGDILVSLDQAKKQASQQGIALRKEVLFLILHSILHLLGHDHAEDEERVVMQKLESQIWRQLIL